MPYHLSKSSFVKGERCPTWLWWTVREPDAPEFELDAATQDRIDQGAHVGRTAQEYVPGGVRIDRPAWDIEGRIKDTHEALEAGAPVVYEAGFEADDVYVAVDILERDEDGVDLIEVKSTTRVKDEHYPDAAIQTHVLRRCGLNVRKAEIMHLNGECQHPDLSDLFVREDVTGAVEGLTPNIPNRIALQLSTINGPCPRIQIGEQCFDNKECPFKGRCWPNMTGDHVGALAGVGLKKTFELMQRGYHSMHDLPPEVTLTEPAQRQRYSLKRGGIFVGEGLGEALEPFQSPMAFLDFETVSLAIPVWNGCTPWEQVPVQFSCHLEERTGGLVHQAWLADGRGDPREPLAHALIEACRDARAVVAYYASFERGCIERLAAALPHLADPLLAINDKLVDLHPVVRDHVYHPRFDGSFSLKPVTRAMLPALAYDDLEVREGMTASAAIAEMMFRPDSIADMSLEEFRNNLLAYCKRDTEVMVQLLALLRDLVGLARGVNLRGVRETNA
jgi:hypothetical protein